MAVSLKKKVRPISKRVDHNIKCIDLAFALSARCKQWQSGEITARELEFYSLLLMVQHTESTAQACPVTPL